MSKDKMTKLEMILGLDTVHEFADLAIDQVKNKIVTAERAIKKATDELNANEHYLELKESTKAMSASLRDVKKRQNAIIQYALVLLEKDAI